MSRILSQFIPLNQTILEIGDWDMVSTQTVNVAHGLTLADIRSISAMIRNDANTTYYAVAQYLDVFTVSADSTNVILWRANSSFFTSSSFDSTTYNRGWITIWHT